MRSLYGGPSRIILSDLSRVELFSSTARRFRESSISEATLHHLLNRFEEDLESRFLVTPISSAVIGEATRLLSVSGLKTPLRSLDAIQLGAFRTYCGRNAVFVSADAQLLRFAGEIGAQFMNILDDA